MVISPTYWDPKSSVRIVSKEVDGTSWSAILTMGQLGLVVVVQQRKQGYQDIRPEILLEKKRKIGGR
jgi:archaellum component FlaG (FlaF/FlaG flagellin family)